MKSETTVISANKTSQIKFNLLFVGTLLLSSTVHGAAQVPTSPAQRQGHPASPSTAGAHLEIMDGSSASYRVTEQFVGISFPNDAIGTTPIAAGFLVIAPDGSISPESKLTFDLRSLKSDQDQRDGYVRNRVIETDKHPLAELVPTRIKGLPVLIPMEGQTGFELTGNMTIHGVTKEVTFQGIATFGRDSTVAGRAKTVFNFETFGLTKPTIGRLLSVDDKIELEVVFKFKRS